MTAGVQTIPLVGGRAAGLFALIDAADAYLVTDVVWYLSCGGYPVANIGHGRFRKSVFLHRLLMGRHDGGLRPDHINGDKLDNRRANLRWATKSQNAAASMRPARSSSGFRGVYWSKRRELWVAQIRDGAKKITLGHFKEKEVAAAVFRDAHRVIHGEFSPFSQEPSHE